MNSMLILGIDPGTHIMGYGLLEVDFSKGRDDVSFIKAGAVYLKKPSLPERLFEVGTFLQEFMQEWKPGALSMEKIFVGKNVDSAFKLGHARGVIMMEAIRANAEVFEYANRAVKKNITGTGAADKVQLATTLKMLLALKALPEPVDASDALALAFHHAQEMRRKKVTDRGIEI